MILNKHLILLRFFGGIIVFFVFFVLIYFFILVQVVSNDGQKYTYSENVSSTVKLEETIIQETTTTIPYMENNLEEYDGKIYHIFFHSLIVYPQKALSDTSNISGYRDNMVTVGQFKQIIEQLYENKFILINDKSLYSFSTDGKIHQNKLMIPKGKKPLILSVDDLSYYSYMKDGGFANRLVIENGKIKTEVFDQEGNQIISDDGDVVPIINSFVEEHPDFSLDGAKGIIALTGFEGIFGYRTQLRGEKGDIERIQARNVADVLKKLGWTFASHSFGHEQVFLNGSITPNFLANDISRWKIEVEPLVGRTNVFIGPFGQIFSDNDSRRKQILNAGFSVLYGVGMDGYIKFFDNYFVMNRINIDGYRLEHNSKRLNDIFGINLDKSLGLNDAK